LNPTAPSFTAPAVVSKVPKEKEKKEKKTKPGAIETTVASHVATAGALPPTPSPKDREMQRAKAELEEAKAEIEMHAEAIRRLTEQNAETASRRDAAAAAAAAAEATLAEVREEASANLGSMRSMHVSELESKSAALEAATRAKDEATRLSEASRLKLAAVEDEFRAALGEFETARADSAREVEELRAVARAAVSGRKDAEALAEELADVCEQQRRALEELSREKRLRGRAEDDAAAARNDLGEMQTRMRKAEKRATLAAAGEKAAREELAGIRETELKATAGLKEVDAIRAQMELAKDNVRIKDAMLESQCELIASLKQEAARSKDAKDGAVKKAAEAERKSEEKARRLEEELRLIRADLAAADAAVDKLERDHEDARVARVAAEDKAEALTREIEERDQMLSYVSGEVENVKSLFGERERNLRAERDELAAAVADRDAIEAAALTDARRAREDAVAVRAECESSIVAANAREAAAAKREHAAGERVRRIEGEMRALLAETASQKRHSRERAQELGALLQNLYT
jgi:chromosome segregation ATPase